MISCSLSMVAGFERLERRDKGIKLKVRNIPLARIASVNGRNIGAFSYVNRGMFLEIFDQI